MWMKGVGFVLGFLAFVGLLYGIAGSLEGGGFYAMWRRGTEENWPWWYYVLAVPAMGAVALLFEAIGELVNAYFEPRPRLRRFIYLTFTLSVIGAFVVFIGWLIWT